MWLNVNWISAEFHNIFTFVLSSDCHKFICVHQSLLLTHSGPDGHFHNEWATLLASQWHWMHYPLSVCMMHHLSTVNIGWKVCKYCFSSHWITQPGINPCLWACDVHAQTTVYLSARHKYASMLLMIISTDFLKRC